jgi:hypothetical protein
VVADAGNEGTNVCTMAIPATAHRDTVVVGGHTEELSIWPHSGYGYLSCYGSFSLRQDFVSQSTPPQGRRTSAIEPAILLKRRNVIRGSFSLWSSIIINFAECD